MIILDPLSVVDTIQCQFRRSSYFKKLRHCDTSLKNVTRVKVDFVSPKQFKEFLLKVSLPMVLILITDVFNERVLD